ncbi:MULTISPECIES: DUF956 family protein [unclassified Streptococcus]|uniref:DUF956 family protein n=1 Tax=unclassified Streptococcus TaxID=2608887 RepID=UPI00107227D7|nr:MULTISPECIES: DUF956 family protein [unclassified Streptococcus]MBF0805334.1 DUF956 family protein [Streptococcus sp. 19428wA2_WM07]TFU29175.1 DUF956 family protein [Streptococcus sp. WM07]
MVQSLNTQVDLKARGQSYIGIGGQVGNFLVGDKALEFYSDRNVQDFIQMPWENIQNIGANVSRGKVSRHFEVNTDLGNFRFSSPDSGRILKIARQHIGDEKVLRLPTLVQMTWKKIQQALAKKG